MDAAPLLMALADGPPIEFVNTAMTAAGATSVTKPSGLELGDIVFVFAVDIDAGATLTTSGGSAWTRANVSGVNAGGNPITNSNSSLFWKILTATDVANSWALSSVTNQGVLAVHYRGHGATAIAVKSTNSVGGGLSAFTLTGFTKAAGTYGVVSFVAGGGGALTAPSGFASRSNSKPVTYWIACADAIAGYVDGAAVSWPIGSPGGFGEHGFLIEVTGP